TRLRLSVGRFISFSPLAPGPSRLHRLQESRMNTGKNDIYFEDHNSPGGRSWPEFPQRWRKNLLLLADPFQGMSTQVLHLHAACRGKACRVYDFSTKFARQLL